MVFEVFRVLIRESRDKIRNLWERRTIEDMLNKLVHRRHDFATRTRALKLVLEFIDAAYDVEDDAVYHSSAPLLPLKHSQLLLRAVDLSVLMRANRDSVGDVAYTAMLPAMPACSPHSVLLSTTPATPDHTLKLLQEVLRHTVRKGTWLRLLHALAVVLPVCSPPLPCAASPLRPSGTSTTRFGFWFRVVQEVFLRMVYVDVFSRLGAARDSASAPAGGAGGAGAGTTGEYGFKPRCPPALQCVLTQWLLNIIQQQPQFLEGLFDSPATVGTCITSSSRDPVWCRLTLAACGRGSCRGRHGGVSPVPHGACHRRPNHPRVPPLGRRHADAAPVHERCAGPAVLFVHLHRARAPDVQPTTPIAVDGRGHARWLDRRRPGCRQGHPA